MPMSSNQPSDDLSIATPGMTQCLRDGSAQLQQLQLQLCWRDSTLRTRQSKLPLLPDWNLMMACVNDSPAMAVKGRSLIATTRSISPIHTRSARTQCVPPSIVLPPPVPPPSQAADQK
jgi:hypothetical protein